MGTPATMPTKSPVRSPLSTPSAPKSSLSARQPSPLKTAPPRARRSSAASPGPNSKATPPASNAGISALLATRCASLPTGPLPPTPPLAVAPASPPPAPALTCRLSAASTRTATLPKSPVPTSSRTTASLSSPSWAIPPTLLKPPRTVNTLTPAPGAPTSPTARSTTRLLSTVTLSTTVCPYVKLAGHNTQTVEAGFPYEDVGATATDTLDGDLTSNLKISDGPFAAHYNNERSGAAIKFRAPGAKSGNYNILVTINGHHQFLPVYCDMTNKATFFIHKGHRTFHGDIKEPEMINAYGKNNGACSSYGLKMASFANSATESAAFNYASELEEGNCPACIQGGKNGVFSRSVKTTDYFCMPIDEDVKGLTGSE